MMLIKKPIPFGASYILHLRSILTRMQPYTVATIASTSTIMMKAWLRV